MKYKFYSGFCLKNEETIFDNYLIKDDYTFSGFSHGAIKAFKEALSSEKRVDLLQLFSPAFFQTQDKKFLRMQVMFFKKNKNDYCNKFLKNITFPSSLNMQKYFLDGTYEELDELLNFVWKEEDLEALVKKGTKIEIYLGDKDKIIDSFKACEFFKNYGTVYFIKNVGHILN